MPASPIERRVVMAAMASLTLAVTPTRVPESPELEPEEEARPEQPEQLEQPTESELAADPEVTEVETPDVPSGGGMAGAIVDPDDPNATRAQSDLEGDPAPR
jgi:hypothetical protein